MFRGFCCYLLVCLVLRSTKGPKMQRNAPNNTKSHISGNSSCFVLHRDEMRCLDDLHLKLCVRFALNKITPSCTIFFESTLLLACLFFSYMLKIEFPSNPYTSLPPPALSNFMYSFILRSVSLAQCCVMARCCWAQPSSLASLNWHGKETGGDSVEMTSSSLMNPQVRLNGPTLCPCSLFIRRVPFLSQRGPIRPSR